MQPELDGTPATEPDPSTTSSDAGGAARADLRAAFRAIIGSPRFDKYRPFEDRVNSEFERRLPEFVADLEAPKTLVAYNKQALANVMAPGHNARIGIILRFAIPAALLALTFVSIILFRDTLRQLLGSHVAWLWWIFLTASGLAALGFFGTYTSHSEDIATNRREAQGAFDQSEVAYNEQLETTIEECYTAIVNRVLGPLGRIAFPKRAPRLVELDRSRIVPSRSSQYLKEFITGHQSSAIGIAGPRGSGKSTLLRDLQTDELFAPYAVPVTAPVHYDAADFVRRLYLDVAVMIDSHLGSHASRPSYLRTRREFTARAFVCMTAILVGSTMVIISRNSLYSGLALNRLGNLAIAGIGVVAGGILTLGYVAFSSHQRSLEVRDRLSTSNKSAAALAAAAIEKLRFNSEQTTRSKNSLDLFSKRFTIEDEYSSTLKDRDLSSADLAKELKELLKAFVRSLSTVKQVPPTANRQDPAPELIDPRDNKNLPRPVVIIVDELDKISDTEDLIETINGLKDLFHVEGVHFVVSVSTDALRNFERRGFTSRDAFDSSFDTIIGVAPLSTKESLALLATRAEGLPPRLSLFCHAWSGGLPRDLLRIARRCFEIYGENTLDDNRSDDMELDTVLSHLMSEDLKAIIESEMRDPGLSEEDTDILSRLRMRAISLCDQVPAVKPNRLPPEDALSAIADDLFLAEALARFFSQLTSNWEVEPAFQQACSEAGTARAARGNVPAIRWEAFERALQALDRSVIPKLDANDIPNSDIDLSAGSH
jgi:hypothetical protein